jgi:hypothetical protein
MFSAWIFPILPAPMTPMQTIPDMDDLQLS